MSKPILSELEYNADDVASAILSKADLSITNEDLGVTDISSSFSFQSGWQSEFHGILAYSFNGFVFINVSCVHPDGTPSSDEVMISCSDSDYHPSTKFSAPNISKEGDSNTAIIFTTDGDIECKGPLNEGGTAFYVVFNAFYRY